VFLPFGKTCGPFPLPDIVAIGWIGEINPNGFDFGELACG
jgi:hypothetical protein